MLKKLNPKAQKVFQNTKKASHLRKEIAEMRDELDNRYGERDIIERQDVLNNRKRQLADFKKQNGGLQRVHKMQEDAI